MSDPFLHFFEVGNRDYVYDTRSNMIFESLSRNPQQTRLSLDTIYRQNWGIGFDDVSISGVKYPYDRQTVLELLRNNMEELIIGVTDDCNFRCRYCVYGGHYQSMRTHRRVSIPEEVARMAVDEFSQRSRGNDTISLGLYGGEPLLGWEMIQGLVPYAKKKMKERKLLPNMTTNGWLLTPEKFEFLRENNFVLMVSLDGPREIHDRNRRTVGDKPTYDRILENLERLRRWDHGYYRDNILFSYVVEDPFEMERVDSFFANDSLTRGHYLTGGLVDQFDNDLDIPVIEDPEEFTRFQSVLKNVVRKFSDGLRDGENVSGIGGAMMGPSLKRIRDRPLSLMNGTTPTTGICIPGVRKLFVTTDGVYHPCEKSEDFNIGEVQTGFSEEKSIELIQRYEDMSQGLCDECWAVRLCPSCFASGSIEGELYTERQKMNCESVRSMLDTSLKTYVELLEDGVDLSDKLEEDL